MQVLREYQARDVERIREAFRRARRICYTMPTGGGKTTVAAEVSRLARNQGRVIWMLVHRDELIDQAAARLSNHGLAVATLRAGEAPSPSAEAHIISIATASRRIRAKQFEKLPPAAGFVLVDEAHHCVADTWREVIAHNPAAPMLGLTATPERMDGTGLGDVFEQIVRGPTPGELVDAGAIVPAEIWTGPSPDMDGVRTLGGDYATDEVAARAAKLVGDVYLTWRDHARGLPTIAFAVNVGHSIAIRDAFRAAGVSAEHVDGETPKDERRRIFDRFRAGEVTMVSNVAVATEGFDVPDMGAVILARPTLSLGLYLQSVGRGLRASPGKDRCIVLDHGFNAARHGDPMMSRLWSLHASKRKKKPDLTLVLRNGGEFFLVCEKCLRCNPRGHKICVACGLPLRDNAPKVDTDVDLVAFDPVAAEEARRRRAFESWHKFRGLARSRGWHPKRAIAIWKKANRGKTPLDLQIFTTPQQKHEYDLWLRGKLPSQKKPTTAPDLEKQSPQSKQTSLF